jgi:hypothetical protein
MSKAKLEERREFLKTKVNPILEVMVADIMKASPENVVNYPPSPPLKIPPNKG